MKFKIKKYLSGGFIASVYLPVTVTETISPTALMAINILNGGISGSAKSSSSSEKGGLTEKGLYDLYSMLKDGGLLNDSDYIIKLLLKDIFNESLLDPFGTNDLSSKYLKAISYINKAKSNLKLFDNAYNLANSNGSLGEYAVTSNGKVVVKNVKTGKLTTVTPEEYHQKSSVYLLLTNGNLLAERLENPQLAFNNNVLSIVENSTSVKEIMDTVKSFLDGLGKNEDSIVGYSKNELGLIKGGISILQAAASKYGALQVLDMISQGGLYELGITSEDLVKQANLALSALYDMLPENQKTLLKLKSNGTESGLVSLLTALVTKNLSSKFAFKADLQTGKKGKGDGEGGLGGIKLGPEERFYLGLGLKLSITFMNGTQNAIVVPSATTITLTDGSGKPNAEATVASSLGTSTLTPLFDLNHATMGGQTMSREALNTIVIDGLLVSGDLPIDEEAFLKGIVKPDFKTIKALEEADKDIRAAGINTAIIDKAVEAKASGLELSATEKLLLKQTITKINKIYLLKNLPVKYKDDGTLSQRYRRFAMVQAKAPEGVFSNPGAAEDEGIEEIRNLEQIDNILNVINKPRGEKNKYNFSKKGLFSVNGAWFLDYDKMYEGVLYVPMFDNFLNAYTGKLTADEANSIENKEKERVVLQGSFTN